MSATISTVGDTFAAGFDHLAELKRLSGGRGLLHKRYRELQRAECDMEAAARDRDADRFGLLLAEYERILREILREGAA